MHKILIFRTDRLGDFLITAILIKALKRNNPITKIEIVSSSYNYLYIKTFKNIDKIHIFKNNFFSKIQLFFKFIFSSYDVVIIHDGKKRSKIISFLIFSKKKFFYNKKKFISHKQFINNLLSKLKYNFIKDDYNIFNFRIKRKPAYLPKNYFVFHFDEKWLKNLYFNNYTDIEPSQKELVFFLNKLSNKIKTDLIVSTGKSIPNTLNSISNYLSKNITILDKIDYNQLEKVISFSSFLISCHGFSSHIASAYNISQLDIIEHKFKKDFKKITEHFRKYKFIYRKKFSNLSNEILKNL